MSKIKEEEIKIQRFASQMSIELEHNNHKPSILEWNDLMEMIADLEYHKAKMMLAIRTGNKMAAKEYIADCANILLAIGNYGGLYDEKTVDSKTAFEVEKYVFLEKDLELINKNQKEFTSRFKKHE